MGKGGIVSEVLGSYPANRFWAPILSNVHHKAENKSCDLSSHLPGVSWPDASRESAKVLTERSGQPENKLEKGQNRFQKAIFETSLGVVSA